MSPIRIGIGHNYNFIVVNIFNIKFISYTAANRINDCINLFIFKDISKLCFSVLITLPRNGNTAWKRRSRPCFAEPPAESPSTRYSFFAGYVIVQVLISRLTYLLIFLFLTTTRFFSCFTGCFTGLCCFNCFSHKKCSYIRVFF